MKLYCYAIVNFRDKCDNYYLRKISFFREVTEHPGTYWNKEEISLYSPWGDILPKDQVEKVLRGPSRWNIKYMVYLLEDDEAKAMLLIKQAIQAEIDELNKQIALKRELMSVCL